MKEQGRSHELEKLTQLVGRLVSERYTPARLRREGESLVEVHAMALEELSAHFTSAREELSPGYLDRPQVRAAYLLYYLPVGVATARAALRLSGLEPWLQQERDRPLRVLDLAAGPLTASLAVALLAKDRPLEIVALDRSARALQDGQDLMAELAPQAEIRVERRDLRDRDLLKRLGGARFDLVVIGHALNELRDPNKDRRRRGPSAEQTAAALCAHLLETSVAEGGRLLLYEPSTRRASQRLIAVRETLLQQKSARVLAPCMGEMPCPLAAADSRSWCHAEQPWMRPELVQACDRAIGHRRTSVKLSYLALARPLDDERPPPSRTPEREGRVPYRVIGGPMRARGRMRRYLCGPIGRIVGEGRESELPPQHWLRQAWRGDIVELKGSPDAGKDRRGGDPILLVRGPKSTASPEPQRESRSQPERGGGDKSRRRPPKRGGHWGDGRDAGQRDGGRRGGRRSGKPKPRR